jgi:ubiquinone/menaquinone biosynthesis C-methylase UbiE
MQQDFDRLASLDSEGWTHNNHYHNFLLQYVPDNCRNALEVGCGTGAFARHLAERSKHVVALDLSPEMIRVAKSRSRQFSNIEFHLADAMSWEFPHEHFDYIAAIATLHHLPMPDVLQRMRGSLKPGGVLAILDLFDPERNLLSASGISDKFWSVVGMGISCSLRIFHNGRLKTHFEVQAAWEANGQHDS